MSGNLEVVAGPGCRTGFGFAQGIAFRAFQGLFGRKTHGGDLGLVLLDKAGLVFIEALRGGVIAFAHDLLLLLDRRLLGLGFLCRGLLGGSLHGLLRWLLGLRFFGRGLFDFLGFGGLGRLFLGRS